MIREAGPITVAAFMDLALNHPALGYYARAAQRSGRAGDFFTSVDIGPLFGDLLELQVAEMAEVLAQTGDQCLPIDLVEAGAGNGRLAADILRAARDRHPKLFARLQLHLVETSPRARRAHQDTLGELALRLASSSDALPESFTGILVANELLDAMPVHQVVMREEGLREVYVQAVDDAEGLRLTTIEGPLSTPALSDYLTRLGVRLDCGWRVEINLRAVAWMRTAARRIRRGFIILIDYGHEARDLYSAAHAGGTLTTFSGHAMAGPETSTTAWLEQPGSQDITAHVDFTSVRSAAEEEGLVTLGFLDQTYLVLGLVQDRLNQITEPRALKTLMMPGGIGSTHKVLILGKDVGTPSLRGCSFGQRIT